MKTTKGYYEVAASFFAVICLFVTWYIFNMPEESPNVEIKTTLEESSEVFEQNIDEHKIVNDILKTNEDMDLVEASYLAHQIISSSKEYDINPLLVASIIKAESKYKQDTVSDMDAVGLGQLTEECVEHLESLHKKEINRYDSFSNIEGSVMYIAYLKDFFNGDMQKVIGGYNAGPYISEEKYPSETKEYLKKVNSYYEDLQ